MPFTSSFNTIFPLVLGVLLAFIGYPVYKISLKIAGFIIGFFVGFTVVSLIFTYVIHSQIQYKQFILAGAGLLLGLLGASSMQKWVKIVLFTAGFSLGMVIARGTFFGLDVFPIPAIPVLDKINHISPGINLLGIILAVALGILAIFLEKFFVILFTSFWGARLISTVFIHEYVFPIVLFLGILVQVAWLSKSGGARSEKS